MLSHIAIAATTFILTNIDDLLILSIYFASPHYKTKNIVIGQYLGIITITAISFLGLVLGSLFEDQWISLLGVIPLALGIKDLIQLQVDEKIEKKDFSSKKSEYELLNVAVVTLANGGDNIGVYIPVFANLEVRYIQVYALVFLTLTGLLCFLANYFVSHPKIKRMFSKYGKTILPVFLILLGLFILKGFGLWLVS